MDKAFIIIPDNNKGKYITKGYAQTLSDLRYFVIEKKIYDLNVEEVQKIKPDLVFCFWSDIAQKQNLLNFFENVQSENIIFVHIAEIQEDIPSVLYDKQGHYCFASNIQDEKYLLNLAVSAKNYRTKFSGYKYTITFAGNPAYKHREEILSQLILNFGPINIFCRSYDFYSSIDDIRTNKLLDDNHLELYKSSYQGYVESQKDLSEIYCSSKINIDMQNQSEKNLNYRTLEILSSCGFLVTQRNEYIVKQFDEGKQLETYSDSSELIDKINFYLKNLNIAQVIAYNGKKNVVSNYSFCDRLKSIQKVIYGKNFSNR